jgi:dephospho-CoA kinase
LKPFYNKQVCPLSVKKTKKEKVAGHRTSRLQSGKPFRVGLTGGIGAGKSLVLKFLAKKRIPVIQTDSIGHQLLGQKMIQRIILKKFGKSVFGKNDVISRKKLAGRIFSDPPKLRKLNALLHPAIRKKVTEWVLKVSRTSKPPILVVVEVPLLFETGYHRDFDGCLCVSAPLVLRRKRLMKRGWNLQEIRRREKFQWSQSRKNRMADWAIFNRGSQKDLKYAVNRWIKKVEQP